MIDEETPVYSIVVFSDDCTLKDITITSDDVEVLYQSDLKPFLSEVCAHIEPDALSQKDIADIYNKLYSYTQVSSEVKERHIS